LSPSSCGRPSSRCCPSRHAATAAAPGVDDRAALAGIVYQLRTGVPWRLLPTRQLGCGSPVTCWRRLRDWQRAGVWQRLHHLLLDELGRDGRLDWSRASLDSVSVRAKRGRANRPEPD
jgi:transposase